jgi:catechol 2,3-dioxygenase-like lactoylglutathione lyase family enzyme
MAGSGLADACVKKIVVQESYLYPMKQHIAHLALLVRDYDEAIAFYTGKLNFDVIEDTQLTPTKRWVLVGPKGSSETRLLLAKADSPTQEQAIGHQSGGRVFLFLYTDDLWRDYRRMQENGVQFVRSPVEQPYGIVAVFEDLYGNQWDLLQPAK